VGVAGSFDFDFVPSATSVCKLSKDGTVNSGYYCADGDGNDYPARPGADPTGKQNDGMGTKLGNVINGGTVFANTRLQLTVDYALTQQLLLGGRVGLVLGTYKGQAAKDEGAAFPIPLHLEVRGSYLLHPEGVDAVLSPMVMVGAGVAPTDAKVDVYVYDGVTSPGPNETGGVKKTFQAWRSTGPVFATLGLGGRYVLGSQMAIYALPLKANLAFPNNGAMFGISPELGIQVGF
jgi:hypothetical protein